MKTYKVKYTIEITQTIPREEVIKAESADAAEALIIKKFLTRDGKECITEIASEEVKYKTENWHDIEDILFNIDKDIQQERKGENDPDVIKMYQDDRKDWEHIIERLAENDFDAAADRYSNLDTSSREWIPDRLYNIFEAMGLV